jgi:hypothetical protein
MQGSIPEQAMITFKKPTEGHVRRWTIGALGVGAFFGLGGIVPLLGVAAYLATITLVAADKGEEVAEQRKREDRERWQAAEDGC